jgi:hypothetical protein
LILAIPDTFGKPTLSADQKVEYIRATASGIPVQCAFDRLVDLVELVPNPRNPNRRGDKQFKLLSNTAGVRHLLACYWPLTPSASGAHNPPAFERFASFDGLVIESKKVVVA